MNATSEWIITHCATPESQGVIATQITPIFQPPLDRRQVLVKTANFSSLFPFELLTTFLVSCMIFNHFIVWNVMLYRI